MVNPENFRESINFHYSGYDSYGYFIDFTLGTPLIRYAKIRNQGQTVQSGMPVKTIICISFCSKKMGLLCRSCF